MYNKGMKRNLRLNKEFILTAASVFTALAGFFAFTSPLTAESYEISEPVYDFSDNYSSVPSHYSTFMNGIYESHSYSYGYSGSFNPPPPQSNPPAPQKPGDPKSQPAPQNQNPPQETVHNSISIHTDVPGASIYIDGHYEGTTSTTVNDIPEGMHHIKITKNHYETKDFYTHLAKGEKCSFFVHLEKISGRIIFNTNASNIQVNSGGNTLYSSSNKATVEEDEGSRLFTVKAFGYRPWSSYIQVYRNASRTVTLTLDPVPFEIESFTSSQKDFNPGSSGNFGKVDFTVKVNGPGKGSFCVYDSEGNRVYSQNLNFDTWTTSFTWIGIDSKGEKVKTGLYSCVIEADNSQTKTVYVNADDSLRYSHMLTTPSGAGLGTVANAQIFPEDTFMLTLQGGYSSDKSCTIPVQFGMLWAVNDYIELSGLFAHSAVQDYQAYGWGALKAGTTVKIGSTRVYTAVNMRIGGLEFPMYYPYSAETGAGLGTGILLGIQNHGFYAGIESEAVFHSIQLTSLGDDWVWKNGILIQYTGTAFSVGAWASTECGFGTYVYEELYSSDTYSYDISGWFRSIDFGGCVSIFLGEDGLALDLQFNECLYPEENAAYVKFMSGISWTF